MNGLLHRHAHGRPGIAEEYSAPKSAKNSATMGFLRRFRLLPNFSTIGKQVDYHIPPYEPYPRINGCLTRYRWAQHHQGAPLGLTEAGWLQEGVGGCAILDPIPFLARPCYLSTGAGDTFTPRPLSRNLEPPAVHSPRGLGSLLERVDAYA